MRISFLLLSTFLILACSNQTQSQSNGKEVPTLDQSDAGGLAIATFAGGCFWCVEAAFERIRGVEEAISGYTGGSEANPTYRQVSFGLTHHAEAVRIHYNPDLIDYKTLLEVFFVAHDPTQLNRQGPDVGEQYRSAVYYHNPEQKAEVEKYIRALGASGKFDKAIVTQVEPAGTFYQAEDYHQNYYELNPGSGYIQNVSRPKVEKVMKTFPELLKSEYRMEKVKN
jgi:peptide-methionine (S)-S-oxide reductase